MRGLRLGDFPAVLRDWDPDANAEVDPANLAAGSNLVAEWDAESNHPPRPERIKVTYDKDVAWRRGDDAAHPPYRMPPATRARRAVGCPLHRKQRQLAQRETGRTA